MRQPLAPDLCVIGAGSGGLAVAAGAAQMGAEVVLVERREMGGDCLNFGCVPSKSLLAAARCAVLWRRGGALGVTYDPPQIDFTAVADSVQRVISAIAPNDSAERFEGLGVRVLRAEARFTGPRTVRAGDVEIRPRRFVIATGSHPAIPPIPGLPDVPYLTNETIFANRELPEHLIIVGGGAIGIEMAQAHYRLGARVTVLDIGPLLPRDDSELATCLAERLCEEGIVLRPRVEIAAINREGEVIRVRLAGGEQITGSHLLVAAGRRPTMDGLDLASAGIAASADGITVDKRLRSKTNRRAFAVGDVAGGPQFTHIALYQAGIVIRNALFRLPARVDYRALPWVTYTDPELAQVGLTEAAARAAGTALRVLRWRFAENDRAQTERDTTGLVKIVTRRNGLIVGASILGAGAGDLILPWALAISQRLKIGALANLIVPYPTRGEAGKRAAGSFFTPTLFSARTRRLVRLLATFG
jgi:pyruvate/2-oxoglutarate dehydrogenase complex dihydrolipoamide dehydrogenase (E3) component